MSLPVPEFSLFFFVMTFGVGYTVLLWAYSGAKRLQDWYKMDAFDKALQTFVIGGVITFVSFFSLKIPISYFNTDFVTINEWLASYWYGILLLVAMEILLVLMIKTIIQDKLSKGTNDYIS